MAGSPSRGTLPQFWPPSESAKNSMIQMVWRMVRCSRRGLNWLLARLLKRSSLPQKAAREFALQNRGLRRMRSENAILKSRPAFAGNTAEAQAASAIANGDCKRGPDRAAWFESVLASADERSMTGGAKDSRILLETAIRDAIRNGYLANELRAKLLLGEDPTQDRPSCLRTFPPGAGANTSRRGRGSSLLLGRHKERWKENTNTLCYSGSIPDMNRAELDHYQSPVPC